MRLQKENGLLRRQLKELSERLSAILEQAYDKSSPKTPLVSSKPPGAAQTELHQKRLGAYQHEHKRILARIVQVESSEYEYQLLGEISAKEGRLKELDKNRYFLNKDRSKVAHSLLSSPEPAIDAAEFLRLTKELKQFTILVERVQGETQRGRERGQAQQEKLRGLEQKCKQLSAKAPGESVNKIEELKKSVLEAQKVKDRTERMCKSKVAQLTLEIRTREKTLKDFKEYEIMAQKKLQAKTQELVAVQKEMKQTLLKRRSLSRPRLNHEALSGFITD
jgi:hypothetical protein